MLENPGPNFGIANIRIEGEYNNIKFWINRQQYDESYPCDGLNTFYIFVFYKKLSFINYY